MFLREGLMRIKLIVNLFFKKIHSGFFYCSSLLYYFDVPANQIQELQWIIDGI
jgi:hypothetical protein